VSADLRAAVDAEPDVAVLRFEACQPRLKISVIVYDGAVLAARLNLVRGAVLEEHIAHRRANPQPVEARIRRDDASAQGFDEARAGNAVEGDCRLVAVGDEHAAIVGDRQVPHSLMSQHHRRTPRNHDRNVSGNTACDDCVVRRSRKFGENERLGRQGHRTVLGRNALRRHLQLARHARIDLRRQKVAHVERMIGGNGDLLTVPRLNGDLTAVYVNVQYGRGANVDKLVGAGGRRESQTA